MDIKELSRRKVAGIPLVWIVLAVAAVGLYAALRLRPAADPVDTATDVPEGDVGAEPVPVFSALPAATGSVTAAAPEQTNENWGRSAIAYLVAEGAGVSAATNAITKYLNSSDLSQSEAALRDKAVKQFGLPPEGIVETNTLGYSGPATKQGEPPVNHIVKGKSDNSFRELARLYYGMTTPDAVGILAAANTSMVEPLRVGQTVTVPRFHKPKYYKATGAARTQYKIAALNGTTAAKVLSLNPGVSFPVPVGTRVRVA